MPNDRFDDDWPSAPNIDQKNTSYLNISSRFAIYGQKIIPNSYYTDINAFLAHKKSLSECARDEKGNRRFHGAFTGGFSAGYNNTVGSKEGWQPRQFFSSKLSKISSSIKSENNNDDNLDQKPQKMIRNPMENNPENYMDEEDFSEVGIAPKYFKVNQKTYQTMAESYQKPNKVSGNVLEAFIGFSSIISSDNNKNSIGDALLKLSGFTDINHSAEKPKKIYSCQLPEGLLTKKIPTKNLSSSKMNQLSNFDDHDDKISNKILSLFTNSNFHNIHDNYGVDFLKISNNKKTIDNDDLNARIDIENRIDIKDSSLNHYGFHGTAFDPGFNYYGNESDDFDDNQFSLSNHHRNSNLSQNLLEEYDYELRQNYDDETISHTNHSQHTIENLIDTRSKGLKFELYHDYDDSKIFMKSNEFSIIKGPLQNCTIPQDFNDNQLEINELNKNISLNNHNSSLTQRESIFETQRSLDSNQMIHNVISESKSNVEHQHQQPLRSSFLLSKFSQASSTSNKDNVEFSNKISDEDTKLKNFINERNLGLGKTRQVIKWPNIPNIVYKRFDLAYPNSNDKSIEKSCSHVEVSNPTDHEHSDLYIIDDGCMKENDLSDKFAKCKKTIDYLHEILKFD